MSVFDRYKQETTWHGKAVIMEIYHLAQYHRFKHWTMSNTAKYFNVSVGLVSENLRIARAFHVNSGLLDCETRQEALNKLQNYATKKTT